MSTPNTDKQAAATQIAAVDTEDYKNVVQQLVKAEHTIETQSKELEGAQAKVADLEQSAENLKSAFAKGAEAIASVLGEGHGLESATAENFFDKLAEALTNELAKQDDLKSKLEEAQAELKKQEEARVLADRKEKIRDTLGLAVSADDTDEVKQSKAQRVEKLVKASEAFDDESFTAWLTETSELVTLAAGMPFGKKKDEDEEDKKKKKMKEDASADGVTDPSILDNVEPATASVSAGTDDVDGGATPLEQFQSLANDLMIANKRVKED